MAIRFSDFSLICADLTATVAFYRRIGLVVPDVPHGHVEIDLGDGVKMELDAVAVTHMYNPDWQPAGEGSRILLGFRLDTHQAVDEMYADLVSLGYRSHCAPQDAFWGERYAEVLDPDGNIVGFRSPPAVKTAPSPSAGGSSA